MDTISLSDYAKTASINTDGTSFNINIYIWRSTSSKNPGIPCCNR